MKFAHLHIGATLSGLMACAAFLINVGLFANYADAVITASALVMLAVFMSSYFMVFAHNVIGYTGDKTIRLNSIGYMFIAGVLVHVVSAFYFKEYDVVTDTFLAVGLGFTLNLFIYSLVAWKNDYRIVKITIENGDYISHCVAVRAGVAGICAAEVLYMLLYAEFSPLFFGEITPYLMFVSAMVFALIITVLLKTVVERFFIFMASTGVGVGFFLTQQPPVDMDHLVVLPIAGPVAMFLWFLSFVSLVMHRVRIKAN